MTYLQFSVWGQPRPAGSKTPGRRKDGGLFVRDSSGRNGAEWRTLVSQAAGQHMDGRELYRGPIALTVTFRMPRPKGHYKTNGELRDNAPPWPTTRPDSLKLTRAIEDAMSGIVYLDDSQIVWTKITKMYGGTACVDIRVEGA